MDQVFPPGILRNVQSLTLSWLGSRYKNEEKVLIPKLSVQIAEAMPSLESIKHIVMAPQLDESEESSEEDILFWRDSMVFIDRSAGKVSVSSKRR